MKPIRHSPWSVTVSAPERIPWGWQAAPAATLYRVLSEAGYPDAKRILEGVHAADFRIVREESTYFITWYNRGGFSLGSHGGELPEDLIDAVVEFVEKTEREAP